MGIAQSDGGRIRDRIVVSKPGRPADQYEAFCDRLAWLSEAVASLAAHAGLVEYEQPPADKFAELQAHIEACRQAVRNGGG
jgi:hypothetical protein